jgi:hypothetical protein
MKKESFDLTAKSVSVLPLLLLFAIAGLLLQSCCMPPSFAKSSCNCGDKPVFAANTKTKPAIQAESVKSSEATTANSPGKTVQKDILHSFAYKATKPVAAYDLPLALAVKSKGNNFSGRKLPLGIKGIESRVIAGPNISFRNSKEDFSGVNHKNKSGIGVQFGVGSTYFFSEQFAVDASLVFKNNRAGEVINYSAGSSSQDYESTYSYSYLSVPILAEIKLSDMLSVMAGPEINYLLGASVKESGSGSSEKTSITKSSVKAGVGLQAGIRCAIPRSPIAVQVIYDHRISSLNKKSGSSDYYPGGGSYDDPASHMKSVQVGVTCALCELMKKNRK